MIVFLFFPMASTHALSEGNYAGALFWAVCGVWLWFRVGREPEPDPKFGPMQWGIVAVAILYGSYIYFIAGPAKLAELAQ